MNRRSNILVESAMRHERRMREMVARRVGANEAEDVVQEVYVKLLRVGRDDIVNPVGYAFEVAMHIAYSHAERRRTDDAGVAELRQKDIPSFGISPEDIVKARQELELSFARVPPTMRSVLALWASGHTYREIATTLSLSIDDVDLGVKYFHGMKANRRIQTKFRDPQTIASNSVTGTIYDATAELGLPPRKIISEITPRIEVASAALAERLKARPEGVHELSPRQFEYLVAELLTDMSYGRVEVTPMTRDGGKDLLAYIDLELGTLLCLVEAKKQRPDRPVGINLVRSLYGTLCAEDASYAMLVTTSYFSPDAREFQAEHPRRMALRDYTHLVQWIRKYRKSRH